MMRAVIPALVCAATPVLAEGEADVTAMTAAIEAAGCVVSVANGDAVLAASGLSEQQTYDVIAVLYERGLISLQEDGSMKLTNEACP